MKRILWRTLAGLALSGLSLSAAAPQEAVSKSDNVNVRAQPKTSSEIVTRLKKGEAVVVLEEIVPANPKKGEPSAWARIVFPTNTPVWVNAGFVDPTNHSVRVKKLNLRAGPGENYSVVGVLAKDDTMAEIRVKENWMEIQAPPNAFAFVALDLLNKIGGEPAPLTNNLVVTPPPVAPPAVASPPVATPPAPPPPALEVVTNAPETKTAVIAEPEKPAPATPEPAPAPPVVNAVTNAPPSAPVTHTPPAAPVTNAAPVEAPAPPPALAKKRVISREGIVHRAYSLSAPTGFALENPETGLMMDYLYAANPAVKLVKYIGYRVIFTGQEGMDPHWPSTPVLMVESVQFP